MPEEWRDGIIVPVYKKGDKKKVEKYRPITLLDTGYKIYASKYNNHEQTGQRDRKKSQK